MSVAAVLFKYLNNFNLDICHYCQISYKSKNSSKLASVQENPAFTLMTSHNQTEEKDSHSLQEHFIAFNTLSTFFLYLHTFTEVLF